MQVETVLKRTTFSVGICALTEVDNTVRLVGQILTSSDERYLLKEVIVVTPNKRLANQLEKIDSRLAVILEEKREGKISALRKLLRKATGDVLVLASADIRLERSSISRLVHTLSGDRKLGAVDSYVELVNGDSRLADRIAILSWEIHNDMLEQLDEDGELSHVAGDLMAVRRDLFSELPDAINDDAYMGLAVRRKGFSVKRAQNATVWIAGPGNPSDYVSQRSRVLRGHMQLIGLVGSIPTTFEFTLLSRPVRNLKVFGRVITRLGPAYIPSIFVGLALELVSFEIAIFQHLFRARFGPWRIIRSTKRV